MFVYFIISMLKVKGAKVSKQVNRRKGRKEIQLLPLYCFYELRGKREGRRQEVHQQTDRRKNSSILLYLLFVLSCGERESGLKGRKYS